MCGIVGIVKTGVQMAELTKMTDSIKHRGPDGGGHWVSNSQKVGLGHRRLAIIDLSNAGSQPMHSADNRYTIVFNGEIYNYLEIKEQLIKKGYVFHSASDTEVLLNIYIEKGPACLQDLDGMFAFAIWDEYEKKLFCARDRFGEKPFYYYYEKGRQFVFASEIKALYSYGISMNFHPHRIGWYFNDNYALNNPLQQDETFYKGIFKLEAGFFLNVSQELHLKKERYWDINTQNIDLSISIGEATEHFKYLFYQSVKRRLRSDVPIGTSLSGGLDSSSVVCVISELLSHSGAPQKTFSARFKDFDQDEGKFIEEVIKGRSLESYYTWPNKDLLFNEFEDFIYHQEEPVGSASQFAQWEVMKLAKRENVTVLLDGQGADEIITGYSHYFDIFFSELYYNYPDHFQTELDAYVNNINPGYEFVLSQRKTKTFAVRAKELIYPAYSRLLKPILPARKNYNGLLDPDYGLIAYKKNFQYFEYTGGLNNGLHHDAKKGKMEVLLRYGDKNSMAYSREVRLPFLSHELAEFVFSLPPWFKIHNGWSKFILRESMKDILPEKITWRKDKIGYQTPQDEWLSSKRFQDLLMESEAVLEKAGILNVNKKVENIQKWAWQIVNVASLIKKFKI